MAIRFLRRRHARQVGRRGGFTIVEMMIAMVLTLIMVYAIAEFYAFVGESVKDGRALIEISGSLRTATQRLKADLDHLTVKVVPPVDDGAAQGYYCFTEGICSDAAPIPGALAVLGLVDSDGDGIADIGADADGNGLANYLEADATNLLGDVDDVLAFTIRNDADPFVAPAAIVGADGIWSGATSMQTASVAEVVWFTTFAENPTFPTANNWDPGEVRSVCRRLLLVRPDANQVHSGDTDFSGPYYVRVPGSDVLQARYQLLQASDVSVRPIGVVAGHVYFAANSLADLTRRENRFMNVWRVVSGMTTFEGREAFPNQLDLNPFFAGVPTDNPWATANDTALFRWMLNGARRGEEVVLSNVLAFDLRVFDPAVVLRSDPVGAVTIQPGDAGYDAALADTASYPIIGAGAYVDMAYSRQVPPALRPTIPQSFFRDNSQARSRLQPAAVYDTWATSYERDGLNQNWVAPATITDPPFDEGTNGLDDDGINGVDDAGERETLPPYPVPLRGIEVRVRVYEPGTRQAQQATVNADFVAE